MDLNPQSASFPVLPVGRSDSGPSLVGATLGGGGGGGGTWVMSESLSSLTDKADILPKVPLEPLWLHSDFKSTMPLSPTCSVESAMLPGPLVEGSVLDPSLVVAGKSLSVGDECGGTSVMSEASGFDWLS